MADAEELKELKEKRSFAKRKIQQCSCFLEGLEDQLSTLAADAETGRVSTFVEDESRFGLIPLTRR